MGVEDALQKKPINNEVLVSLEQGVVNLMLHTND
jgi:hypothetical protein